MSGVHLKLGAAPISVHASDYIQVRDGGNRNSRDGKKSELRQFMRGAGRYAKRCSDIPEALPSRA